MIRKILITIVGAVAMVAMIQTTQASITLGDLVTSHGTLTIDDKTFSDFSYVPSLGAGGQLAPEAAALVVTTTILGGVYYLNFNGGLDVVNSGPGVLSGDLLINYTVTVNDPSRPIFMIDQSFAANATAGSGNVVIGETVTSTDAGGNSQLSAFNPVDLYDLGPLTAESNDNLGINPNALILVVSKDIRIDANGTIDPHNPTIVGLSRISQSFHEVAVPEPTTMIAGALLLLPFGASTLRILRKKRTA